MSDPKLYTNLDIELSLQDGVWEAELSYEDGTLTGTGTSRLDAVDDVLTSLQDCEACFPSPVPEAWATRDKTKPAKASPEFADYPQDLVNQIAEVAQESGVQLEAPFKPKATD